MVLTALARAFRSSPTRIAQRVLLASGERAGLLTNGEIVRLLLCDPSRSDSHLSVGINGWRQEKLPPDSFRILKALAGAEWPDPAIWRSRGRKAASGPGHHELAPAGS